MDRVALGRALGYGTRHAAKTLLRAAKAASAPSPARPAAPPAPEPNSGSTPAPTVQHSSIREAREKVMAAQRAFAQTKDRARTEAAYASRSLLSPVRRAGGVLWLEMTGSVFTLFALFLAQGLWKLRGALHASPRSAEAQKFYLFLVILGLFTYFAITSFVRARRRGRRS